MKKYSAVMLVLLGSFSAMSHAETVLKFGVDPSFPPFESKAADGTLVGFDIDLGNAICKQANAKCEWVETAYDSIIPALNAKKFDAVLSAMAITPKRKAQVNFTDVLYNIPSVLVAKKGSTLDATAEALKGKVIGVSQGTTQETYAMAVWQSKGVQVVSYQNQDAVNLDLESGRIDATFTNAAAAETGFLKTKAGADFAFVGKTVLDPQYLGEGAAIALRKDDQAHMDIINKALAGIHANGVYKQLEKKYFTFDVFKNNKPSA